MEKHEIEKEASLPIFGKFAKIIFYDEKRLYLNGSDSCRFV